MLWLFFTRKSPRIPGFDYSSANYYFITICTHERKCLFGMLGQLTFFGKIVDRHVKNIDSHYQYIFVDKYVVMPNHLHLILIIGNQKNNSNIYQAIGCLKTGITKEIRRNIPDMKIWQRSFHDHVIRTQSSYQKIWEYIENNPVKWEEDCFYISEI